MRCGILTFHFAHNYGAVLQAYSLKNYLTDCGYDTSIINYAPRKLLSEYSLNPLARDHYPKAILRRTIRLPLIIKQSYLFSKFSKEKLGCKNTTTDINMYKNAVKSLDAVICGSDQIWNEQITGKTTVYYADIKDATSRKIAYAASFGTDIPTVFQKKCIREILPSFYRISTRESSGVDIIKNYTGLEAETVLDPVFLCSKDVWKKLVEQSKVKVKTKFVLYYSLRDNDVLAKKTEAIAKKENCDIYMIHPTGNRQDVKGTQLYNVGPCEFLWLISHAKYVCTSSFHAVAFSLIFGKKVVHVRHSNKESRVSSLIEQVGADKCLLEDEGESIVYDFSKLNHSELNRCVEESRYFLMDSLGDMV